MRIAQHKYQICVMCNICASCNMKYFPEMNSAVSLVCVGVGELALSVPC